jgi:hypothetical protein
LPGFTVPQSTTAPPRPKKLKGERVIATRVNGDLYQEISSICQELDLNAPAVFREGLILFCQSHPGISDESTQRVIAAVSKTKSFIRMGRICPDLAPQSNNGEG